MASIFDVVWILTLLVVTGFIAFTVKELWTKGIAAQKSSEDKIIGELTKAIKTIAPVDASDLGIAKEVLGTNKFTTIRFKGPHASTYFTQLLENLLAGVTHVRTEVFDWSNRTVLEVLEEGVAHVVIVEYSPSRAAGVEAEKFNIQEFVKDGRLDVTSEVRLLIPHVECDTDCQVAVIQSIREAAQLSEIKFAGEKQSDNTIQVYELMEQMGSMRFMPAAFEFIKLEDGLARLSFNPLNLDLGTEHYQVPVDAAKGFLADELLAGRNILILGDVGTGKTSYATNVIANLGDNVALVRLDHSTIQELVKPAGKQAYQQFLLKQKGAGVKNVVFYVDEGQQIAHSTSLVPLLELMAGLKTAEVKTSVIAALSAKKADLDQALVREGRAHHIIELTNLSSKKLRALATHIKAATTLVLSPEKLDVLCARKDGATLAQLWACFSPKESVTKWAETFYKYRINQIPEI